MKTLVIQNWLLLVFLDFVLKFRGFRALLELVRKAKIRPIKTARIMSSQELCRAVDLACVFYFKNVPCLQRSVATALLLRRRGWPAEIVTGVQLLPFRSHAWVEIQGVIVNDKPYMHDLYQVLEKY